MCRDIKYIGKTVYLGQLISLDVQQKPESQLILCGQTKQLRQVANEKKKPDVITSTGLVWGGPVNNFW